ncbi:neuronal acetylcholine receptor subunit alpha-9 isoform X2 [Lingula anatina]|uniref:Neuronal acetylcholine receptor subunit alpha-9 isoform X2 n=1 Tax=Lingula anatina TaxID=7574 RepID=A0A1S3HTY7_LINAN|nr:neuronal acetylcholine receptor subunit alpha-9 isoform X2 [Lingula anatina]|eukprot:XP_013388519.1 neuronal acetylcholine receptor subunit alpha-9 isoform X2 [Lingula anatina]
MLSTTGLRKMKIWTIFLVFIAFPGFCFPADIERQLVQSLMVNYDVDVRPVENTSVPIVVKLGMALNQIIDVDEVNQIIVSSVWFRLRWNDFKLRWNSSSYGGLSSIRISSGRIWRPDLTLYTDVKESASTFTHYNAIVSADGSISWNFPAIVRSTCSLNVRYFPYDEQRCPLKFGSWTFDGLQLDLKNLSMSGDSSTYVTNGEWELKDIPVVRNELYYNCCPEPYPDVTFTIIIRRQSLFYLFNLVLPCALIVAITILVFYLPPESGEKVSLSVTVLLALTVFLQIVAQTMPAQSEVVPLIGEYFGAAIALLSVSTALTVIVLNLHFRGSHNNEVPYWMRKVVLEYMAKLLFMTETVKRNVSSPKKEETRVYPSHIPHLANGKKTPHYPNTSVRDLRKEPLAILDLEPQNDTNSLLLSISKTLDKFEVYLEEKEVQEQCETDWQLVARVVDRFLLVVFSLITLIVSVTIFSNRPTYD